MLCLTELDKLPPATKSHGKMFHLQSRQPSTALKSFFAHSGTYLLMIVTFSSSGLSEISTFSSLSKSSKRMLSGLVR